MKINKFYARGVHGHYNFNLNFNGDITFLVGINGSGKTTALRLMQAAMTFDLLTLFSIKFKEISIEIQNQSKIIFLQINNTGGELQFSVNGNHVSVATPILGHDKPEIFRDEERLEGYFTEQRMILLREFEKDHVFTSQIERPLFLGLERRADKYSDEYYYYDEDVARRFYRPRKGALEGIDNCQRLIERAYKRYRKVSDGLNSRLINFVVDSMFEYYRFDPDDWVSAPSASQFQGLIERRREIEILAKNLSGNSDFSTKINLFFSKITEALNVASGADKDAGISIEWLLNKAQVQRIYHLLAEMDRQKKAAEKQYRPIAEFLDSLNRFFADSKKNASVDSLGKLKVSQHGSEISLASMSSGEKQLLILLGHARFARGAGGVIIVDEPEVSLHLRWQEQLIDEITQWGDGMQFIFATHSPEVVGYKTNKCVSIN